MNAEITKQIAEKALSYLNSTEVFLGREVPILLQEVILWGRVHNSILVAAYVLIPMLLSALSIYAIHRLKNSDDDATWEVAIFIITICSLIFCPLAFFEKIGELLEAWLAPRVFLINFFKEML